MTWYWALELSVTVVPLAAGQFANIVGVGAALLLDAVVEVDEADAGATLLLDAVVEVDEAGADAALLLDAAAEVDEADAGALT